MKNTKTTTENLNEQPIEEGRLNEVVTVLTPRKNKTVRIQQDFKYCPTLTEQHTAHLSDLNYLIAKFKPDELAAYIQARAQHRQEIIGHDFSAEPDFTEAKNITYQLKKSFDELSDDVKMHFKNHVEFLKFIDNPANQEKMLKLGLMTKKEVSKVTTPTPPTTQEETKSQESPPKPS